MSFDFRNYTIEKYLEELGSSLPVPGGGGTSSMVAALGVSLGNMVGSLTLGKKKYAEYEKDIKRLIKKGESLKEKFLKLSDEDAEVFEPLSKAYGMPKDDPKREKVLEKALKKAAGTPVKVVKLCGEALELIEEYSEKGSRLALSDVGCAAALVKGAVEAASLNVYINTGLMKDREYAENLNSEIQELALRYLDKSTAIYDKVLKELL